MNGEIREDGGSEVPSGWSRLTEPFDRLRQRLSIPKESAVAGRVRSTAQEAERIIRHADEEPEGIVRLLKELQETAQESARGLFANMIAPQAYLTIDKGEVTIRTDSGERRGLPEGTKPKQLILKFPSKAFAPLLEFRTRLIQVPEEVAKTLPIVVKKGSDRKGYEYFAPYALSIRHVGLTRNPKGELEGYYTSVNYEISVPSGYVYKVDIMEGKVSVDEIEFGKHKRIYPHYFPPEGERNECGFEFGNLTQFSEKPIFSLTFRHRKNSGMLAPLGFKPGLFLEKPPFVDPRSITERITRGENPKKWARAFALVKEGYISSDFTERIKDLVTPDIDRFVTPQVRDQGEYGRTVQQFQTKPFVTVNFEEQPNPPHLMWENLDWQSLNL